MSFNYLQLCYKYLMSMVYVSVKLILLLSLLQTICLGVNTVIVTNQQPAGVTFSEIEIKIVPDTS